MAYIQDIKSLLPKKRGHFQGSMHQRLANAFAREQSKHRFKLHLVYPSENLCAFKNIHRATLALYYQSNLTAWITRALFKDHHHHHHHHHHISPFFNRMSKFSIIVAHYSVHRTHVQYTRCTYFTIYLILTFTGPLGP